LAISFTPENRSARRKRRSPRSIERTAAAIEARAPHNRAILTIDNVHAAHAGRSHRALRGFMRAVIAEAANAAAKVNHHAVSKKNAMELFLSFFAG
jgi:hypothetical protein